MSPLAETRIRELCASQKLSNREIAEQLIADGIPTAHGGVWCEATVHQAKERMGLIKIAPNVSPAVTAEINNLLSRDKRPSCAEITAHLNAKKLPSPRGKQWHLTSVYYLLRRMRVSGEMSQKEGALAKVT
jgi:hypothetical protein